jgi:hypothetical protein
MTVRVILEDETLDAERYINYVLLFTLKSDNKVSRNSWIYHQDCARPHTHHFSQKSCAHHFPAFIPKARWPSISPDLCPLDSSLWNELGPCDNKNNTDR